jgi:hypothetical protein
MPDRSGICKECGGSGRVSSGKKWLLLALLLVCAPVEAYEVETVYNAIATEAIGEGREGMTYVASCFWNRDRAGLPLGSSGARRSDLNQWLAAQPESLLAYAYHLAVRVVHGSGDFDRVKGGTHFESTDFPTPYWVGDHKEVFRHGKHVFYK